MQNLKGVGLFKSVYTNIFLFTSYCRKILVLNLKHKQKNQKDSYLSTTHTLLEEAPSFVPPPAGVHRWWAVTAQKQLWGSWELPMAGGDWMESPAPSEAEVSPERDHTFLSN